MIRAGLILAALLILALAARGDGIWSGGGVIGSDGIANQNAVGVNGVSAINALGGSVCSDTITLNGGARNDSQDFGYGVSPDFDDHALGQKVSPSTSHGTCSAVVIVSLSKAGSPADNVTASIQADASGIPSGVNLATASVAGSTLGASFGNITFPAMTVSVSSGSNYWVVLSRSGSDDAVNFYHGALWDGDGAIGRLNKPGVPGWYTSYSATFVGSLTLAPTMAPPTCAGVLDLSTGCAQAMAYGGLF